MRSGLAQRENNMEQQDPESRITAIRSRETGRACFHAVFVLLCAIVAVLACPSDVRAQGYVVAIGGGAESDEAGSWSERPYRFVVDHANGRPVVIVSAHDESEWLPDYFRQLGAVDAVNLKIDSRTTADAATTEALFASAGAVFLKGGDQWDYVRLFDGTRTELAIRAVFERGGVVAGTSAGAHVLGSVVYDARNGSVYPEEAIRDAHNRYISFTTGFLNVVPGALFDTHFTSRGRLARLLPMVARADAEHLSRVAGKRAGLEPERQEVRPTLGIGLDDNTALMIGPDGRAEVTGEGSVTFVRRTGLSSGREAPGKAPVLTNVAYDQLTEGFVFDLVSLRVTGTPPSAIRVVLEPSVGQYAAIRLDGASSESGRVGAFTLSNPTSDPYALLLGALREEPGTGRFPGAVVVTQALVDPDYFENRIGGMSWMLANHPGLVGVLLDRGASATVDDRGRLRPEASSAEPSMIVLDTRPMRYRDFSTWRVFADSTGPRQSVAIVGVRAQLLASGWGLDVPTGRVIGPSVRAESSAATEEPGAESTASPIRGAPSGPPLP